MLLAACKGTVYIVVSDRKASSARAARGFGMVELALAFVVTMVLAGISFAVFSRFSMEAYDASAKSSSESLYSAALALEAGGREFNAALFTADQATSAESMVYVPGIEDGLDVVLVSDPSHPEQFVSSSPQEVSLALAVVNYSGRGASVMADLSGQRYAGLSVLSESGNCVVSIGGADQSLTQSALPPAPTPGVFVTSDGTEVACSGVASFTEFADSLGPVSLLPIAPDGSVTDPTPSDPPDNPVDPSDPYTPSADVSIPLDLTAFPASFFVELSWTAGPSAQPITDFIVEYRQSSSPTWLVFDDGVSTTPSTTVTALTNGTEYAFRVSALAGSLRSAQSEVVLATPFGPPGQPTDLAATAADAQVGLSWLEVPSTPAAPVTGYIIYKLAPSGAYEELDRTELTGFVDAPLANGLPVSYKVSAYGPGGEGPAAGPVFATPMARPGNTTVSAALRDSAALVSWTAVPSSTGSPVDGYKVYVNSDLVDSLPPSSLSWDALGLVAGNEYTFTIRAFNSAGEPAAVVPSESVTITAVTAPSEPLNLVAVAEDEEVDLNWDAPSFTGFTPVTDYLIEYRVTGDITWMTHNDGTSTRSSGEVEDLTNGVSYDFQVKAVNAVGVSVPSNLVATAPITVPGSPSGLSATPGDTQVFLDWRAVESTPAAPVTGYRVFRLDLGTGQYQQIAQVASTSFTDTSLPNGVEQTYRLATYGPAGQGPVGASVFATPITRPANAVISASLAFSSVNLSWTSPNTAAAPVTGYNLYVDGQLLDSMPATTFDRPVAGLTVGQTYTFTIRPFNLLGEPFATSSSESVTVTVVEAVPPTFTKIPICHAGSSKKNPYTRITPATPGVLNGHIQSHAGPLFPAANWGDIIPPFGDYPGMNWPEGRAIYEAGCQVL